MEEKRTMSGDGVEVPPYRNTGAQNTWGEGLRPCVDWVQATFKNVQPDDIIADILLLKPEDFTELERGKYGYMSAKRLGHITVLYNGHPEMGVHMELSGQGCREYESYEIMDWRTLFNIILRCEAKITRLDVALDDFKGYWKIKQIIRKVKSGELVSKFKHATRVEKIKIEDGSTAGHTVYFGSNESRIKIRMYDKLLEQKAKDGADQEEIEGLTVWNRTEIQSRDERAQTIAGLIANDVPIGAIVTGILKYYLRFVVKGKDRNKSRWKTAKFWDEFLKDAEPLRLAEAKQAASLEKKIAWLDRQVAPTLAMIVQAMEGDMEKIYRLINEGAKRLKERDVALINEYRQKKNRVEQTNTVVDSSDMLVSV